MRSTGSGLALMPSTTNCSIGYKTMTTTRKSPIAHLIADAPAPVQAALHHPVDMVKIGAKGPRLVEWGRGARARIAGADLRQRGPWGADGVLARVGAGELILECRPEDELWVRSERGVGSCGGSGSIGWSSSR